MNKLTVFLIIGLLMFVQSLEIRQPLFSRPAKVLARKGNVFVQNVLTTTNTRRTTTNTLTNAVVVTTTDSAIPQQDSSSSSSSILRRRTQQLLQVLRGGNGKAQSFLQEHPFLSAVCITTCNAIVADLLTQLVFQKSTGYYNLHRTVLFGIFGFIYQGCIQYALVNQVWERIFPGTSAKNVIKKIFAMNFISDPFFFLPIFYLFKQILLTISNPVDGNAFIWSSILHNAMLTYKSNAITDLRNSWLVWFPGHAVTYGIMPTHKRIPWMAFVSLFYMIILSITRGG